MNKKKISEKFLKNKFSVIIIVFYHPQKICYSHSFFFNTQN